MLISRVRSYIGRSLRVRKQNALTINTDQYTIIKDEESMAKAIFRNVDDCMIEECFDTLSKLRTSLERKGGILSIDDGVVIPSVWLSQVIKRSLESKVGSFFPFSIEAQTDPLLKAKLAIALYNSKRSTNLVTEIMIIDSQVSQDRSYLEVVDIVETLGTHFHAEKFKSLVDLIIKSIAEKDVDLLSCLGRKFELHVDLFLPLLRYVGVELSTFSELFVVNRIGHRLKLLENFKDFLAWINKNNSKSIELQSVYDKKSISKIVSEVGFELTYEIEDTKSDGSNYRETPLDAHFECTIKSVESNLHVPGNDVQSKKCMIVLNYIPDNTVEEELQSKLSHICYVQIRHFFCRKKQGNLNKRLNGDPYIVSNVGNSLLFANITE